MRSRAGASPTPATTRSESMSQPMRRFPAAPRLRRRIGEGGLKEGNDAGERQASKLNDRYQRIEINLHKGKLLCCSNKRLATLQWTLGAAKPPSIPSNIPGVAGAVWQQQLGGLLVDFDYWLGLIA